MLRSIQVSPSTKPRIIWLFGRSGAGKTTLAQMLRADLQSQGESSLLLDGDQMRSSICRDLGFSVEDRMENHRRIAELASLALSQGHSVIAATMAPLIAIRQMIQEVVPLGITWIYLQASLETCLQRDPKLIYQGKRGSGNPQDCLYEEPLPQELCLRIPTDTLSIEECIAMIRKNISPTPSMC